MKTLSVILIVAGGLLCSSISRANVTSVIYASDGDGAISCPTNSWSGNTDDLSLNIDNGQPVDQYWGPGHIVGTIDTSSKTDPSLVLTSDINNDTGFTWTGYQVNVYMDNPFLLSAASVTSPTDWTLLPSSQLTAFSVTSPHGSYEAQLLFSGGTPVANGGDLNFGYTVSFSGATSYSFTQEMIPVPEPGTIGFAVAGMLLLGGFLMTKRHRKHS